MSWVTVVWSMIASACLTLAGMHLFIWFNQRKAWGYLLFAFSALATSLVGVCELWMMRSTTTAEFGTALRWLHFPAWVVILTLVGFVQLHLRAGRPWLAWTVVGARTLSLLLNFSLTPNLNFREITSLRQIPFLGETVAVAVGVPNPWMLIGQASLLLFLVFVVDATYSVWRRGDRRQALSLGGSIGLFVALATLTSINVFWGAVDLPVPVSGFYLLILFAMSAELSRDALRAAQLAGELRDSEHRMVLAAEAAHLGLWHRNLAGNDIHASDNWRTLFGFSKSEPLDLDRVLQKLHPDDREMFRQAQAKAIAGEGLYDMEFRIVLPGGEVRWIASRGGVNRSSDSSPKRMHGVSMDITVRKLAEERFRLVVDVAPNAMLMTNREGLITLLNVQAEKVFGYAREELLGRPIEILIPDRHRATHADDRQGYLQAPAARSMGAGRELFGRRKDGSEVPVEVGLTPIAIAEGTAVLASIIDTSARRKVEAETAQQRNELAHLSRVTMLGELSGSLAHELNQPLAAILANAQAGLRFLTRDPENLDEIRNILEDIAENDKRAGEVIRRLRSLLTKGESRHDSLDVNQVALDVSKLMHSDLVSRNVTLKMELAVGLPVVEGDQVQLQQVLLNLVINGCDAMDSVAGAPGERVLTLRTAAATGANVEVTVSDCGPGIPLKDLERIFDPFVSTKAEGMGLGLAVCRTIVSAHDGRLWATNNADRGAAFHFTLPAARKTAK